MLISDHAGSIANVSLQKYGTMSAQTRILHLSDLDAILLQLTLRVYYGT
jgi:hypothetical protein